MAKQPARTNTTAGIFILDNEAVFPWNAYVYVPDATRPGHKLKYKLPVEFKHVTPERRLEILAQWRDKEIERARIGDIPKDADDVEVAEKAVTLERMLLDEAVHRFPEVRGKDGELLPADDSTKQGVLSNAWAVSALGPAYITFLQGQSAEGN